MKAKVFDSKAKEKGSIELPKIFSEKIREDIIAKVFEAQKGLGMQPYGAKEGAGAQYSASGIIKKKRHDWKGSYGKGISRIPRKIMSRHGASFNWIGATVSNTRGGRRPHAPRSEKILTKKINKKELQLAYNSALAGTINTKFLEKKYGKKVCSGFIFEEDILTCKTKEFIKTLKIVYGDSTHTIFKKKSIRAGIGKMRGRKYKSNAGMVFIIGKNEEMKRKGISVVKTNQILIKDLCPNGEPGRITAFTKEAIKELGEKK